MHLKYNAVLTISSWESSDSLETFPQVGAQAELSIIRYIKTKTSTRNSLSPGFIPLDQDSREAEESQYTRACPLSPSSWTKAQYFSLNPSFVQGPTMTLLTFLSTPSGVWLSPVHPLACSAHDLTNPHSLQPLSRIPSHALSSFSHHCTLHVLYFPSGRSFLLF